MSPPNIKVRGAGRAKGIPHGYVLGRVSPGNGDVELLKMPDLARLGVQGNRTPGLLAKIAAQTVLANTGPGEAVPVPLSISAILDFISSTRGSVLYRGAASWAALAAGTAGQVLTTNGAGADPSWATASGGGYIPLSAGVEPGQIVTDGAGNFITVPYP